MRFNEKLAEEIGREVSEGDPTKSDQIKKHLWKKSHDEAYTFNIFKGKVKITSNWSDQERFEKDNKTSRKKTV